MQAARDQQAAYQPGSEGPQLLTNAAEPAMLRLGGAFDVRKVGGSIASSPSTWKYTGPARVHRWGYRRAHVVAGSDGVSAARKQNIP